MHTSIFLNLSLSLTFSHRMCVGEELAKMFLNLFAANILLNFNIKVGKDSDNMDLSGICGLTLTPPEYNLIFEKR